jgi:SAM-dependent methyltransferase
MDDKNQKELASESGNWLSVSRTKLICGLIEQNLETEHTSDKGTNILDFGAGAGKGVEFWRKYGEVDVVEPGNFFLSLLRKNSFIRTILSNKWEETLPNDTYDFILLLDVIEHLDFPSQVLSRLSFSTKKGGYLIITVPAYEWLFSNHDVALDHKRRYTRHTLNSEIPKNFELIKISHFVTILFPIAAGIRIFSRIKYLLSTSSDRNKNMRKQSSSQLGFLDKILKNVMSFEVSKIIKGSNMKFGLSIVAVYKKIE